MLSDTKCSKNCKILLLFMSHNFFAPIAQLVERIHGKDEVTGSNPVWGSKVLPGNVLDKP